MHGSKNEIDLKLISDEEEDIRPKVKEAKKCERKRKVLLASATLFFLLVVLLLVIFALKGNKVITFLKVISRP